MYQKRRIVQTTMKMKLKILIDEFSTAVPVQKYSKVDYNTWRQLVKFQEREVDIAYVKTIGKVYMNATGGHHWEFLINDNSLGEFLWDKLQTIEASKTTSTLNTDLTAATASMKAAIETGCKALSNFANSVSTSSNFYEKQPTVQISEKGLKINGQNVEDIIDEATGNSMKNNKENNNMNLFKNVDFGSCENDNVKMSMYGVAVKNANNTWVSYDSKSGNVVDVDILNFSAKYLYKMPVAIKDIAVGDTVIHCRKPMFVTKIEDGKLLVIDPAAAEEKIVLPVKSPFGFDIYTKVVNLFGNLAAGASEDSPLGNMLPLMLLADGDKTNDMFPLMFAMGGGKFDMSNPMMMYFLMKDKGGSNDMLPLLLMNNYQNPFGKCKCDCGHEG